MAVDTNAPILLSRTGDASPSTCGVSPDSSSIVTTSSCGPVQARLALVKSGTGQRARSVQAPPEGSKAAAAPGGTSDGPFGGPGVAPALVWNTTIADPVHTAGPEPPENVSGRPVHVPDDASNHVPSKKS